MTIRNLEFLLAGDVDGPISPVNDAMLKLACALVFETQQGGGGGDLVRIRLSLQTPAGRP